MDIVTVYIDKNAYNGYITVNAWHSRDQQYPLLWHQKYMGYTMPQIKKLLEVTIANLCDKYRYGDKYKIEYVTM